MRPGQTLYCQSGHSTEEGYHAEGETWTQEGEIVTREWWTEGRDCDGRLDRQGRDECPLDQLHELAPYITDGDQADVWAGVTWPNWQQVASSQRDEYAEMAGY